MTATQREQLEQLFEVVLQYKEGQPAVSMNGKVGEYVGHQYRVFAPALTPELP